MIFLFFSEKAGRKWKNKEYCLKNMEKLVFLSKNRHISCYDNEKTRNFAVLKLYSVCKR
jgi:hypothetical protein